MRQNSQNGDVHDFDTEQRHLAAKVDRVQAVVRAFRNTPPTPDRGITRVEDLFDEQAGLPR